MTVFVDGERYAEASGPVPPVGAKVWAGDWCTVDRVEWWCNKRRVTPMTATMGVEVYLRTLPEVAS